MAKKARQFSLYFITLITMVCAMACSNGGSSSSGAVTPLSTNTPYIMTGQVDSAFGTNGQTPSPQVMSLAIGVAAQSTGQLIFLYSETLGESFYLNRYNSDGSLDTNFGTAGTVTLPCTGFIIFGCSASNVLVESNDKIIVVTNNSGIASAPTFEALRFNADGSTDTNYGTNGVSVSNTGSANAAFIDTSTNDLVIAGAAYTNSFPPSAAGVFIARLLDSGSLDASFGGAGLLSVSSIPGIVGTPALSTAAFNAVTGEYFISISDASNILLGDLTDLGGPDTTFGVNGVDALASSNSVNAVAVQANGSILLGSSSGGTIYITRLLPNGSLDPSFGVSGVATLTGSSVQSLFTDGLGNIIVVVNSTPNPSISRLTSSGIIDTTFGSSGTLTLSLVNNVDASQFLSSGDLALAITTATGAQLTLIQ